MRTISFGGRGRRSRTFPLALLVTGFFAVTAADAGATLRVENHIDPADDTTRITYRLSGLADGSTLDTAPLGNGHDQSFGPGPGTYTFQALLPAGWRVNDIKCVGGPDPSRFAIDVPNGRVTITHGKGDDQTCAFTNGKVNAPPSSGVAPSPPAGELPAGDIPKEIALLGVSVKKGYVVAKLRIIKRSVINLQLRRGTRLLARKRVTRRAGNREVEIALRPETIRWYKNRGRKQVLVRLRARVAERQGAKKVFWYQVMIPL
jgi:hypothetical protein